MSRILWESHRYNFYTEWRQHHRILRPWTKTKVYLPTSSTRKKYVKKLQKDQENPGTRKDWSSFMFSKVNQVIIDVQDDLIGTYALEHETRRNHQKDQLRLVWITWLISRQYRTNKYIVIPMYHKSHKTHSTVSTLNSTLLYQKIVSV